MTAGFAGSIMADWAGRRTMLLVYTFGCVALFASMKFVPMAVSWWAVTGYIGGTLEGIVATSRQAYSIETCQKEHRAFFSIAMDVQLCPPRLHAAFHGQCRHVTSRLRLVDIVELFNKPSTAEPDSQ